jgi:hypothetical protein
MAEHAQLYRKRIAPAAGSNVDDLVSKNVLAHLRRDPPPRPPVHTHGEHLRPTPSGGSHTAAASGGSITAGQGGNVEASDLISSMAKRLGILERESKERQGLLQQVGPAACHPLCPTVTQLPSAQAANLAAQLSPLLAKSVVLQTRAPCQSLLPITS